jgi:hypothetical protein
MWPADSIAGGGFMIENLGLGPEFSPVLLIVVLAGPLIAVLGLAIRRSIRRQECAQLRDRLVDAARTGELDVADWRLCGLIDWFDQVATTGRTITRGRHTADRADRADLRGSLAGTLATTLLPLGPLGRIEPSWPQPLPQDAGAELRAVAVRYRGRRQRPWYLPQRSWIQIGKDSKVSKGGNDSTVSNDSRDRTVVEVRGVGSVGSKAWPAAGDARRSTPRHDRGDVRAPVVTSSLVEEIFAVAGSRR